MREINRRAFVKNLSIGLGTAPMLVSASVLGRSRYVAPSDRIALGLIGCGSHGAGWNLDQIFRNADSQVIAVCDVDKARLQTAKEKVDNRNSKVFESDYRACTEYGDFRELINRDDIDAVVNCTPDHWHVIPAIMALKAGKDVICEKPLTLTVEEGRILCDEIIKTKRVFQTASENRSVDTYIKLCELVRNGRIGRLEHMSVSLPSGNESRGDNFMVRDEMPVPEGFDYKMWLGQAPLAPYVPARCHGSFRWISAYSGGRLTDWGAHMIDLAQWANNTESTGPVEVSGEGRFPAVGELFDTAYEFKLHYRYENGVTMDIVSEGPAIRFVGSDGWVGFKEWRGPLEASHPEILDFDIGSGEVQLYHPSEIVARDDNWKGGEHRNFIDCVKSRKETYAPAEVGHRTITIAHIGNIAMRLARKLTWDPTAEQFVSDTTANDLLSRSQREPWTMGSIDAWIQA
jgi:predicted dehydrogenase